MKLKLVTLIVFAMTLSACAKQDMENYKKKGAADQEAGRDSDDIRAKEMETRLTKLQNFHQAMAGTFKGRLPIQEKNATTIQFVINPTIPAYVGDRVRTADEITYDLTNLALDVQQNAISKIGDEPFSSGCNYSGMKPITDQGFMKIGNNECPVTFVVSLIGDGEGEVRAEAELAQERRKISQELIQGRPFAINRLQVEMRSIHRSDKYIFIVERVE